MPVFFISGEYLSPEPLHNCLRISILHGYTLKSIPVYLSQSNLTVAAQYGGYESFICDGFHELYIEFGLAHCPSPLTNCPCPALSVCPVYQNTYPIGAILWSPQTQFTSSLAVNYRLL